MSLDRFFYKKSERKAGTKRPVVLVKDEKTEEASPKRPKTVDDDFPVLLPRSEGLSRERYTSVCEDCRRNHTRCPHFDPVRLRMLIVGHNPSVIAARTGYYYGNPRNAMMGLLVGDESYEGIFPSSLRDSTTKTKEDAHTAMLEYQNKSPNEIGVGFTDVVMTTVGSDASEVKINDSAASQFLRRLVKARKSVEEFHKDVDDGSPRMMVFTSKTLCVDTMVGLGSKRSEISRAVDHALEGCCAIRSDAIPYRLRRALPSTEIWVTYSTSGRAAGKMEERKQQYKTLAEAIRRFPFP